MSIPSLSFLIYKMTGCNRGLKGLLRGGGGCQVMCCLWKCLVCSWPSVNKCLPAFQEPSVSKSSSEREKDQLCPSVASEPLEGRAVMCFLIPPYAVPTAVPSASQCLGRVTLEKRQPDTKRKLVTSGKAVGVATLTSGSKALTPRKELKG